MKIEVEVNLSQSSLNALEALLSRLIGAQPVKVEATPVKVEATPVKVEAAPVKVEAAPVKVEAAPEPVKAEPVKAAIDVVMVRTALNSAMERGIATATLQAIVNRHASMLSQCTPSQLEEIFGEVVAL
jgi:hypothetical protein